MTQQPDESEGDQDLDHGPVSGEEKAVMKANLDHFTGATPPGQEPPTDR